MSEEDLATLLKAMQPVPYIVFGGHEPRSQQENANDVWQELGNKLGFDYMSVKPNGLGDRFFSAIPISKS